MPEGGFADGRTVPARQCASLPGALTTARRIVTHPENRGRRASRLVRWVTWRGWQRVARRPWTVELHDGVRMICHPHDNATSLALKFGLFDAEEMRFLLAWLRPGDTFLDVGANVAPYSLLATTVPGVSAKAFEPGTLAQQRARANIDLNGVGDRVSLEAAAVSDTEGEATFTADRWDNNALVGDGYAGPVERVRTITLDTYAASHEMGNVTLVKVDVEGHEMSVISGGSALISRHRPALIVEVNDPGALRRLANGLGYQPVAYDVRSGSLDERTWPDEPGGNVILVASLADARTRMAARADV